ncbi:MAG: COX15/CtaA family protein [Pseudomonadota bacterium]
MRTWLIVLGLMVYAMILIGGATRLTDSGLSITEWDPISGTLPPLSAAGWDAEFDKYRETAEYQLQNRGMSMPEFQYIYWWEWGHRLFGRLIGLVAVIGYAVFWMKGWLSPGRKIAYAALIALGGLQGFIGWWMVASGIGETTRVDVAPYRLATHFTLALVIIGFIAWLWSSLGTKMRTVVPQRIQVAALLLLALTVTQMASGALVAGLDAGRTYTDWPLMAGETFPANYLDPSLGARSLFEGREATQFNHRTLAYVLLVLSLMSAWVFRQGPAGRNFLVVAALMSAQAVWGILTLVNAAPMGLALVHQGLGVIVFIAVVRLAWRCSAPVQSAAFLSESSPPPSTNTA